MKASLSAKLEKLTERFEELSGLLSDPDVIAEQKRFRAFSKEYAELEPVVQGFREYRSTEADMDAARALAEDVAKVRSHPFVPEDIKVGGFIYDVDTGLLNQKI